MSATTLRPPAARRVAVPPEPVLPLTVEQYHAMIRSGALTCGDPIELLEGWLVNKQKRQVFLLGDQVPVVLDGNEVGLVAVDDLLP